MSKDFLKNPFSLKEILQLDILPVSTVTTIEEQKNKDLASTTRKSKKKPTCIAALYKPLVQYLRVIGFCPFTINQDSTINSYIQYQFKWRSLLTLYYSLVSSSFTVLSMFFVVTLLLHGLKTDFKELLKFQGLSINAENYSDVYYVPEFGTRLVPATFPFFSVTAALGLITSMPNFLQLLKKWPEFQEEYFRIFPHRTDDDPFLALKKYRNTTFTIFPSVGVIAAGSILVIMYDCERWGGCIFPKGLLCFPTVWATFTMLIAVGSHSTHFFMLRTLREAYTQIWKGIQFWNENENEFSGNSSSSYRRRLNENIKNWTRIMVLIKAQVHRTGKAIGFYQVFMIIVNFIYLCLGVFSTCLSPKMGEYVNRGYILLMFCGWGFGLLIVKAFVCETILAEEKLVVNELRKVDVGENVPCLIKINSLISMINDNPAEIRFWNVVTLNKSFLLQLFGQVATYLIVLIQFENIHRNG